jgi:hypothetical protein
VFNFSVDQFFGQILSLARSRIVHDSIANRAKARFLLLKHHRARIVARKNGAMMIAGKTDLRSAVSLSR